jgi:hypothetical protein
MTVSDAVGSWISCASPEVCGNSLLGGTGTATDGIQGVLAFQHEVLLGATLSAFGSVGALCW